MLTVVSADVDDIAGVGAIWIVWRPKSQGMREHIALMEWYGEQWRYGGSMGQQSSSCRPQNQWKNQGQNQGPVPESRERGRSSDGSECRRRGVEVLGGLGEASVELGRTEPREVVLTPELVVRGSIAAPR
ncbi:hypothetical protein [Streptomyces sp. HD]|uniref:hypothetical protein n=1 Tax=Streptomyces sp. HD TaxID=3020892 RepID=UPI002330F52E|nr:hypothetical protein [Streptomyces sp. HD]MDC0773843.1 hypothetical protein [Streptomyces sp. HD]